ncbi:HAD family hydrolase [Planotetraspora kaengkrachanensis]|uniref:Hydrolase n=1 Tax=Planotetraspora kaengkrachanensis TaxID=575193 RepID=A0A8J3PQA8_9ACTN|nr:HAD-IA family hydrolase [Planotetraspora kaengkrachanensis]GIG78511.1 hydrolase [Planotetraspora kaengkrachanensis]
MTLPFAAVLCDFDGVIRFYDTAETARLERAAGLPEGITSEIAFARERDLPALLGKITTEQWVESIVTGLSELVPEEQARRLGEEFASAEFRVDEDVLGLLRRVQAHVPVVLVTNATLSLEADLASLGLTHFADDVVSSARVGVVKPDRRIYEIAAERAGVAPRQCLFVDDRRENVEAAEALGMTGVLYGGIADLEKALDMIS